MILNLNSTIEQLYASSAYEGDNVSKRFYKCLKRAGILKVKDIFKLNQEELKNIPGIGRKTYNCLVDTLREYFPERYLRD